MTKRKPPYQTNYLYCILISPIQHALTHTNTHTHTHTHPDALYLTTNCETYMLTHKKKIHESASGWT